MKFSEQVAFQPVLQQSGDEEDVKVTSYICHINPITSYICHINPITAYMCHINPITAYSTCAI